MTKHGLAGWRSVLFLILLLASQADATGPVESAESPAFVASPGETFRIPRPLAADGAGTATGKLAYVISDYEGQPAARGEVDPTPSTLVTIPAPLDPGYYEIKLGDAGPTYGLLVAPIYQGEPDPFFCIDAGLSWLTPPDRRAPCIQLMKRIGVGTVRERVHWSAINHVPGQFNWEADRDYDQVRAAWTAAGIHVLEVSHDAPAWTGPTPANLFPQDLPLTRAAWSAIATHWQPAWAALEAWNEPDIKMFAGDLPADQYIPYVKTLAYALAATGRPTPLVGGVFTHLCPDEFRNLCAESGMLDCVQCVSLHTYDTPLALDGMVAQYRRWLRQYHHESMPLWITEAGKSSPAGPPRPALQNDSSCALDIAAKAVEARALGVARFYPFVLPAYTEGAAQFGMLDEQDSPVRALAAYAACIRLLTHTRYLGSLREPPAGVKRARVFTDENGAEAVAVLYTGEIKSDASVTPPFTPLRAAGIDGRPLPVGSDRRIAAPDGLVYAWLPLAQTQSLVDGAVETPGRWPMETSLAAPATTASLSGIVMQPRIPLDRVVATCKGYTVRQAAAAAFPLRVRVNNFGPAARPLELKLEALDGQPLAVAAGPVRAVTAEASAGAECEWTVDLRGAEWRRGPRTLRVTARAPQGGVADTLAFNFGVEQTLADWLARYPAARPLELARPVTPVICAGGTMETTHTVAGWRLTASFGPGDRWVYPKMPLPAGVSFAQWEGVIFRARLQSEGEARLILWEQGDRYGFTNASSFIPADGQWHAVGLRFADLDKLPTHIKPDGTLDLGAVTAFSLGFNSKSERNTLEIADFHVIPRGPAGEGAPASR